MGSASGARGQARQRVMDAALELFAEHGIAATSLQMIADRIGVTKAAVYHQFAAKNDIVLAVLADGFDALDALAATAERLPAIERDETLIRGTVSMMVTQRQVMSAIYRDPEIERLIAENEDLSVIRRRLDDVRNPPGAPDPVQRRLAWAVIGAGFTRAILDPEFADIGDDQLTEELIELARRVLA